MSKYIKTHEQLLKLDGKKISCEIDGYNIEDAKISVRGDNVFIIQDKIGGKIRTNKDKYNRLYLASSKLNRIECKLYKVYKIKLKEEEEATLKIDDKVKLNKKRGGMQKGEKGVIIGVDSSGNFLVKFNNPYSSVLHKGVGTLINGLPSEKEDSWYCGKENLIKIEEEKEVDYAIIDGEKIELTKEISEKIKKSVLDKEELLPKVNISDSYHTIDYELRKTRKLEHVDDDIDYNLKVAGNFYKSKEIAQKKIDKVNSKQGKVFAWIENWVLHNIGGYEPDWDDVYQTKYSVCYNHFKGFWDIVLSNWIEKGFIYMPKELAEKLVHILNSNDKYKLN